MYAESLDLSGKALGTITTHHQTAALAGKVERVRRYDATGGGTFDTRKLSRTVNTWECANPTNGQLLMACPAHPAGDVWVRLKQVKEESFTNFSEAGARELVTVNESWHACSNGTVYGNVAHVRRGESDGDPQVHTHTDYVCPTSPINTYIVDKPSSVEVRGRTDDAAHPLEKKWFWYDGGAHGTISAGNVTKTESLIDQNPVHAGIACSQASGAQCTKAETTVDGYGNVTQVKDWINASTARLTTTTFDTATRTYPELSERPLGQKTASTFDPKCGVPLSESIAFIGTTEPDQLSRLRRVYDPFCRLSKVWRPGEDDALTSLKPYREYSYWLGAPGAPTITTTSARETHNADQVLTSAVFADALGRVIQHKAESIVDGAAKVVTTSTTYDAQSRPIRQGAPTALDASTSFQSYTPPAAAAPASALEYDALGRVTKVTNLDETTFRTVDYSIAWQTKARDECYNAASCTGLETVEKLDGLGRIVERVATAETGAVQAATQYEYDEQNRLTGTTQGDGSTWRAATKIVTQYDSLGRKTQLVDPDSGTWTYGYDWAGNLAFQDDPKGGQHVQFCYDLLDRVTKKRYMSGTFAGTGYLDCAQNAAQQITYQYDSASYGVGRLYSVTDLSGVTTYQEYTILGQPKVVDRTMDAVVARSQFAYDRSDHVIQQKYPDGEWVLYGYDGAGRVTGMQNSQGSPTYLSSMKYDVFGRPTQIGHANGPALVGVKDVRTYSALKANNFRLEAIASTLGANTLQDYRYSDYWPSGRLKTVQDVGPKPTANADGSRDYTYDALGRLTQASGGSIGTRPFVYDVWGNITQQSTRTLTYQTNKPHTPNTCNEALAGQFTFDFDTNGNSKGKSFGQATQQKYFYDGDDRVRLIDAPGAGVAFAYDHAGFRSREIRGAVQYDTNGVPNIVSSETTYHYTPVLEVTETATTSLMRKYYYAGDLLIASREYEAPPTLQVASASAGPLRFAAAFIGAPALLVDVRGDAATAIGWLAAGGGIVLLCLPRRRRAVVVGIRVRPADVAVLVLAVTLGTMPWPLLVRPAGAKDGPTPTPVPNGEIHHYHLDHLGSPQMVTDGAGMPIRWMRYTPYGEVTRWDGASTTAVTEQDGREFTGYDTEPASGLQYAGARFYDPTLGLFLSHDPKREFASPYTYTNWDPVNATDPTGAEISLLTLALIGFFVGFAANAIQAGVNGASIGDAFRAGAIGGAIGFVSAPLGAFVLSEGIGPIVQHLASVSLQQARDSVGTALLIGSLGQAGYGFAQGDYTGVIGLGLSVGLSLALAQGANEETSDQSARLVGGKGTSRSKLDHQDPRLRAIDQAANDAIDAVNPTSVRTNTEYNGYIFENPDGSFASTPGVPGAPCPPGASRCFSAPYSLSNSMVPPDAKIVAYWHTHGAGAGFEYFSPKDIYTTNYYGRSEGTGFVGAYLGTPGGNLQFYEAGSMRVQFTRGDIIGTVRTK